MLYGYGRVSTDLQENSASAQTEKLEAYLSCCPAQPAVACG